MKQIKKLMRELIDAYGVYYRRCQMMENWRRLAESNLFYAWWGDLHEEMVLQAREECERLARLTYQAIRQAGYKFEDYDEEQISVVIYIIKEFE